MRGHLTGIVTLCIACVALADPRLDAPPPGTHWPLSESVHDKTESFRSGHPIVGSSYFYWYDVYTGSHIRNPDGTDALTTHPPASAMADVSYKSVDWHYSQLRDMAEAGIDFLLPVAQNIPGDRAQWSIAGLPPLVAAHERMLAEARANPSRPAPPKIGMFYDTSTLRSNQLNGQHLTPDKPIDLTTRAGRDWFYITLRDFFSMIPPDKWARIDGKPILFLHTHSPSAVDDSLFAYVQQMFRKDFATELFIVREASWPVVTDAAYTWGSATGLTIGDGVAGVGPGYDDSAVPGRKPTVVSRQNGAFYDQQWQKLLRMQRSRRPWMVHVETWNDWHEGSDVARSEEYGDRFIKATARYAQMFRNGRQLDPSGPFARADRVRWSGRQVEGIELLPSGNDGCWQSLAVDGSPAVAGTPCNENATTAYLYFRVDDSYLYDEMNRAAEIAIVFRDDGSCDSFRVEYDNCDATIGMQKGAFRPTLTVPVGLTNTWRTARFVLPQVRFIGRTNSADLRLAITGIRRRLVVREVIIRKLSGTEIVTSQPVSAR